MNREDMLNAFEFQNNCIVDDHVDPITTVKIDILIPDRKSELTLEWKATQMQFVTETFFINRFKQSWTDGSMNLDRSPYDFFCKGFKQEFAPCLRVSVVNHVCRTPTLNSGTSGFSAAASSACTMASRVSLGSMILSIQRRAAP